MENLKDKAAEFCRKAIQKPILSSGNGSVCGNGFGGGVGLSDSYGVGFDVGFGFGYGFGGGDNDGYGDDSGIKKYNGYAVHYIDQIPTIITAMLGNYAKGYIVCIDLSLKPCYIAKREDIFAHGDTLKIAVAALNDKVFEQMPVEDRISEFWACHNRKDKYGAKDLYNWHHRLTGSCEFGRKSFAEAHQIDLDKDEFTVDEFIELTQNSYGGDIISKMSKKMSKYQVQGRYI